jgi:hypothetical protein
VANDDQADQEEENFRQKSRRTTGNYKKSGNKQSGQQYCYPATKRVFPEEIQVQGLSALA